MKFREKLSFYTIVLKILLGSLVCCYPQTFTRSSCNKGRKLPLALSADVPFTKQPFQNEINGDIWNVFQQPVLDTFNYPKIECPLKPKLDLVVKDKTKAPFNCKSRSKNFPKFQNVKELKIPANKNEFTLPLEFSSTPNYRNIANFPEVEYPLSASETWKPNYWYSQLNDYSFNNMNMNTDYYCRNPTLNEIFTEFKPLRKGTNVIPKTQTTFSTKSYRDPTKISNLLKNKQSNGNPLINGNQKSNIIGTLETCVKGDQFKAPLSSLTPYSAENKFKGNYSYEVCPKESFNISKKVLESDVGYNNLTLQSEILVNACADIFKDEIKSVLKTMADNIIIHNLEKVIAPAQLPAHASDKLESNSNLNIYEEFTSPELLKNRRSQDLNEFTKYNKDLAPTVDLESKLLSTDLLIDSYADKFHKEMTSILKSNADDFILNQFEKSKSNIVETNINRSSLKDYTKGDHLKTDYDEHLKKDFSKINYEPILPVTELDIHAHADNLHNKMSAMVQKTADNILLNKFESSNVRRKPSVGTQTFSNNNKVPDNPKPPSPKGLIHLNRGEVNNAKSNNPKIVDDNDKMTEYNNNPVISDMSHENKITTSTPQSSSFPDLSTTNNVLKSDVGQDFCPESDNKVNTTSTSCNGSPSSVISRDDKTCSNEESVTCKNDANLINDLDKEDGMFLPAPDKGENDTPQEDLMSKEIELDEEFTTDSYPENDGSYALSTVAPPVSTGDLTWRDVSVIEPDKQYRDELEQYFIMN